MKCPICCSELESRGYYDEYGRTEESYEKCVNGCYYEEFAYGTTRTRIFGEEFYEHFNFTKERCHDVTDGIEKAIKYWKENDRYLAEIMSIYRVEKT